jgi:hypothetical protein
MQTLSLNTLARVCSMRPSGTPASGNLIRQRFPPRKMPNPVYNAARWGPWQPPCLGRPPVSDPIKQTQTKPNTKMASVN